MIRKILDDKPTKLFIFFTAFFVANALIAECIGGKLFSLESTLGFKPFSFSLFGQSGLSFTLTCGVLLWPLEFVMTDIINEFYGPKAVRRISYIAVALISYAFLMFFMAMNTAPAGFWVVSNQKQRCSGYAGCIQWCIRQGMRIIIGSLVAFLVSQIVDVTIFHKIKKTHGRKTCLACGRPDLPSFRNWWTVISFYSLPSTGKFSWQHILAIGMVNYTYKFIMAIVLTPLIYLYGKKD